DFLRRFGFEKHVLRGLSVKEQAALFASATVVIAPHGAGLANLVFCSPGTKVIELFSPSWPQPTYWELSHCLGLDYYYLIGRSDGAPVHPNPKWVPKPDYSVNLNSLSKLMALAGLT
ncbi:MAG: glycosyltransferase family 61 protein, partial [Candidatus Latescibacteria bacterium]|nr:glycosyltransferase family 61 protein [Candidatus Latescibacterota bacterium]